MSLVQFGYITECSKLNRKKDGDVKVKERKKEIVIGMNKRGSQRDQSEK
jgi:hypothetical protein